MVIMEYKSILSLSIKDLTNLSIKQSLLLLSYSLAINLLSIFSKEYQSSIEIKLYICPLKVVKHSNSTPSALMNFECMISNIS